MLKRRKNSKTKDKRLEANEDYFKRAKTVKMQELKLMSEEEQRKKDEYR